MALFNSNIDQTTYPKCNDLTNLIKQIREIIEDHNYNQIHIHILQDEVYFEIYESRIPIIVNFYENEVFIDSELFRYPYKLGTEMLAELNKIIVLLQSNLDVIKDLFRD